MRKIADSAAVILVTIGMLIGASEARTLKIQLFGAAVAVLFIGLGILLFNIPKKLTIKKK